MNWFLRLLAQFVTSDVPSPGDWLPDGAVQFSEETGFLVARISHLQQKFKLDKMPVLGVFVTPDTNSMDPVFDAGHHSVLIKGRTGADHEKLVSHLKPGDIVVVGQMGQPGYVIHRLIHIGKDEVGTYYRTQGDNVFQQDPRKYRAIHWIRIGGFY